jgi:hypothetical protein
MSSKIIDVYSLYKSESLITRHSVDDLEKLFPNNVSQIQLDFTQIRFSSRSFFDELYARMYEWKKQNISVKIIHLSPELAPLAKIVEDQKKNQTEIRFEPLGEIKEITI